MQQPALIWLSHIDYIVTFSGVFLILILTRHGQTQENKRNVFLGQSDSALSEEGFLQAKKVAKRLAKEKIDFIYSSDLLRAADTAKEIAKYHAKAIFKFTKELRERNLGEFEGKSVMEGNFEHNALTIEPEKGESIKVLLKRAGKFLSKILKKHKDKTVLVVAHSGFNRALAGVLKKTPVEELRKVPRLKNTGVSIFEIEDGLKHKVHVYDSVEHLET